jgi:hypothetical protein
MELADYMRIQNSIGIGGNASLELGIKIIFSSDIQIIPAIFLDKFDGNLCYPGSPR